ncbi:MAG: lactonase family protein [Bacteroidetes bacterium]|nr:MAG: lactonase family protein [Bacteroidota bacterium]
MKLLFALMLPLIWLSSVYAQKDSYLFAGTYTARGSEGIYVYRFDPAIGALSLASVAKGLVNPSFLALSPDKQFLYAVEENDPGHVSAFRFDEKSGQLSKLNTQPSEGVWPCHIEVDASGKWCIAGNYGSGDLCVLPIQPDGSLGKAAQTIRHSGSSVNAERQEKPHVHSINIAPNNRDVFVADLGTDKIMAYRLDSVSGTLSTGTPPFVKTADGAGPRHFAFHPGGKFAYAVLELNATVTAYTYEAGSLTPVQTTSTLPADYTGSNSCADIHVSPDGKFLYSSNRGHNSLAVFAIDAKSGKLTPKGHQSVLGKTPRNFAIDPSGKFLLVANQESDNIQIFRRNRRTGSLTYTGQETKVSMPVCLKFR